MYYSVGKGAGPFAQVMKQAMPIRKLAAVQLCPAVAGPFAHVYGCAIYTHKKEMAS